MFESNVSHVGSNIDQELLRINEKTKEMATNRFTHSPH